MAKGIAEAFPHMDCTVLDLPHVVSNYQRTISTQKLKLLSKVPDIIYIIL